MVINVGMDANVISSYVIIFAGLMNFVLSILLKAGSWKWKLCYFLMIFAGITTWLHHAYDGIFAFWFADIVTSIFVIWAAQFSLRGDLYINQKKVRNISLISDFVILFALVIMGILGFKLFAEVVSYHGFGWYEIGEALVVFSSLVTLWLLYFKYNYVPRKAKIILNLFTIILFLGFVFEVIGSVWFSNGAYLHSLWHIMAAFSFFLLWLFNHARYK